MTEIFDGLFLGNKHTAKDARFMARHRIVRVVNCTNDLKSYFENLTSVELTERKSHLNRITAAQAEDNTMAGDAQGLDFDEEGDNDAASDAGSVDSSASSASGYSTSTVSTDTTELGADGEETEDTRMQDIIDEEREAAEQGFKEHSPDSAPGTPVRPSAPGSQLSDDIDSIRMPPPRSNTSSPIKQQPTSEPTTPTKGAGAASTADTQMDDAFQTVLQSSVKRELLVTPKLIDEPDSSNAELAQPSTPSSTSSKSGKKKRRRGSTCSWSSRSSGRRKKASTSTPRKPRNPDDFITTKIDFVAPIEYMRIRVVDSMETEISKWFNLAVEFIAHVLQPNASLAAAASKTTPSAEADGDVKMKDTEETPVKEEPIETEADSFTPADHHLPGHSLSVDRSCVLVHCREGRSRSVSVIIAYAIKYLNWPLKAAYEHVYKQANGKIRINDGFKRQLMEYERRVLGVETNSLDFFPKRKRVRYDCEMTDAEFEEQLREYEEDDYRPRKRHKKHKNKKVPAESILKFFSVIKKPVAQASTQNGGTQQAPKQISLLDMFKSKEDAVKKKKEEDEKAAAAVAAEEEAKKKKEQEKPKTKQTSIAAFFKPKATAVKKDSS